MIVACPKCGARYRIDKERLPVEGARLRCSRCEAVFRVSPPVHEEPVEAVAPAPREQSLATQPTAEEREKLVLIADPEMDAGKSTAQAISEWGLRPVLVHDGVDAILTIQRMLPQAVVLDAALPKMFGFQICELMKRNESLRSINVVLIGAIHDRERYRRPPTEFYGADAYVERPNLPDALRPILADFGLVSAAPAPEPAPPVAAPVPAPPRAPEPMPVAPPAPEPMHVVPPEPAPEPEPAPTPPPPFEAPVATDAANEPTVEIPLPAPPAPEQPIAVQPVAEQPVAGPSAAPGGAEAEVQKAERLARIVVSDIVLYNEDKFAAAVQAGNVLEAMESDMQEGRALFVQRIDARIRESRDFLAEEIVRVARQRGMT
jgi:predicted Zn finger-like uncharacterized protein